MSDLEKTQRLLLNKINEVKANNTRLSPELKIKIDNDLAIFETLLEQKNTLTIDSVNAYLNLPWLADKFVNITHYATGDDAKWQSARDDMLILSSHIQDRVANLFTINIPDPKDKLKNELAQLEAVVSQVSSDKKYLQFIVDYRVATNQILANRDQQYALQLTLYNTISQVIEVLQNERENKEQQLSQLVQDYSALSNYLLIVKIIAISVLLTISLLLTTMINRWLVNWINRISSKIQAMSQGDFTANIQLNQQQKTENEFVKLSESFNRTTAALSDVTKKLLSVSNDVSCSSQDLVESMTATKENAQLEVDQVTLVSTAVSELSSTADEVSSNASVADSSAQHALNNVHSGQQSLDKLEDISNQIDLSIQDSLAVVHKLNEFSTEIGMVIDVINGVAEQTNLLALNAAIEAARAGESGRGFAVVADEVRNLAAKTQNSTVNIQNLIESLQKQSMDANTSMLANSQLVIQSKEISSMVKDSFNKITESVEKISEINASVATASEEQSRVTQEIFKNVSMTNDLISKNASSINKCSLTSENLSNISNEQSSILSSFKYTD
ncbi:HAMP domain-containing methyl-accepting chemotaxis protein [Vibrio sp. MACH09]|uniref:methyl-accepting chemotaxis protein n=1 Tax=Vibrio sp. MACH09 TaxID=3025122 RepID=UPI00295E2804|nr:HAMP domain-containing methyl-accepting chemotaxis protein [Vibrio sp. MACH09]